MSCVRLDLGGGPGLAGRVLEGTEWCAGGCKRSGPTTLEQWQCTAHASVCLKVPLGRARQGKARQGTAMQGGLGTWGWSGLVLPPSVPERDVLGSSNKDAAAAAAAAAHHLI